MDANLPIPILIPKVQIPPSRPRIVSRQRLLRLLDEGMHRKLTLISAPAGYGKSTLLSEWAATYAGRLAWFTLEVGDNDPDRFLAYLISAMQTADVSLSDLEGMLGASFSLQPMPQDAVLAILVNRLSLVVGQLAIVLDDYHLIENQEIHGFLNALIDNLPPNIHLLISSRADPPLRLARLRAKDQLNEVTERDLRFTPQEVETFYDAVMGLNLTSAELAELETRTEGWVTGLQLAGLSLKDREHPGELIATLTGTQRYILDYLVEEVFSGLDPQLQKFLLRVSILDRLTPGLCDALAGDLEKPLQSKAILELLDANNLFVVPLDSQRQWYRFHSLFAEFLQDRLKSQAAQELADLHGKAAAWYTEHDLLPEAVNHSFYAGDIDGAADLIQSQVRDLLTRGEIRTLNLWVEALPEGAIRARPQLGLARAWGKLMRDQVNFWNTIEGQIDHIAKGFGTTPEDLIGALAASEPGSTRRAGLGELAMLMAYTRRDIQDTSEAIELFKAALEYLPVDDALLRGFTLAGLASSFARMGAIKPAEEAFAQAAQLSLAANSIYGYVACTDWQATMQAEQGQLRGAVVTYRQGIEKLSSQVGRPLPLSGHVFVGLAGVLLEWNDLPAALENVQAGLQIGNLVADIDALLKGYVILARFYQVRGDLEAEREALHNAERVALTTNNSGCLYEVQAWKAQLELASGELEETQRWASRRGLGNKQALPPASPPDEIEQLTYARLQMSYGKPAEALPILEVLVSRQEQSGRRRALIESLAVQSLCYRQLGRTEEAIRTLARALLLAEPEGFIRVFIQEGPSMAALLRNAGAQGHSPEYVKRLLEAFGEPTAAQEAGLEPLSERELDVLRLVAGGLTNADISKELVIGNSTVKTHINRIYSKLGVSTRTQAVVRARQLKILP